jgi:glycerophosphoryl diester phosphodiesterase
MRKRYWVLSGLALLLGGVYVFNASWRVSPPENPDLRLIAHRGIHQTFDRTDLENDTCTAARMDVPTHDYLENTLPSMQAAFAAGADVVELDIHPTTDGQLAVIHDWTLDCRTNGTGVTREHDMASLKALDIGYGYTRDGTTYPFRGKGVGMMPELKEVFAGVPDGRFLINFKSREAREAQMLADLITAHPQWAGQIWGAYGGEEPSRQAGTLMPGIRTFWPGGMKDCLIGYMATGWMGVMPEACRNTAIMVPINFAPSLWGWPNLFMERARAANSDIVLLGPYGAGDIGTAGIDTLEQLALVPGDFDGFVWTNKIEIIGPAAAAR